MDERKKESEVIQSCLTLCNPMNCSLPGSSLHGIFQARVLEWVAISFSSGCESWTIKKAEHRRIDAMVLEKTIESALDSREIKPVNPKGN